MLFLSLAFAISPAALEHCSDKREGASDRIIDAAQAAEAILSDKYCNQSWQHQPAWPVEAYVGHCKCDMPMLCQSSCGWNPQEDG